jgi:hypothetical protein
LSMYRPNLLFFLRCMKKSKMPVFILNYRMFYLIIYECGEETP